MSRGLTHPDAHIGSEVEDIETKLKYRYEGYEFFELIENNIEGYEIIRTIQIKKKSGALFKFTRNKKNYGIIYYSTSVTPSTCVKIGKLKMRYINSLNAKENLYIQSDKLTQIGKKLDRKLNNVSVPCMVFKSKSELEKSIFSYFKEAPQIESHIENTIKNYFKSDLSNVQWCEKITNGEKRQLGKYLGELIIGAILLHNNKKAKELFNCSDLFSYGKISEFIVPTDPSFCGIDSALMTSSGNMIQISSKFGSGAAASVFGNLLTVFMESDIKSDSVLSCLSECTKNVGYSVEDLYKKKGAKEILYEYGTRIFLGLDKSSLENPMDIFSEIKSKNISDKSSIVLEKISNNPAIDDIVKMKLPDSVTAAFSRELAKQLNEDQKTISEVSEILHKKDFWQANLHIPSFLRGDVKFNILRSRDAKIKFIGNKSVISDINGQHGLLNYELKYG